MTMMIEALQNCTQHRRTVKMSTGDGTKLYQIQKSPKIEEVTFVQVPVLYERPLHIAPI